MEGGRRRRRKRWGKLKAEKKTELGKRKSTASATEDPKHPPKKKQTAPAKQQDASELVPTANELLRKIACDDLKRSTQA